MIFPDPIFEETVVRNNEARQNKFTDLIANSLGFYVGLKIRKYFEKENNS